MEKLFSTFNKVSKTDWLNQVGKDIGKNAELTDFNFNYSQDINISPFLHFEDKKDIHIFSSKIDNEWLIGEIIVQESFENINKSILEALEGGANAVEIPINSQWQNDAFNIAFNGVYLNFVFIDFRIENEAVNIQEFILEFEKYIVGRNLKTSDIKGSLFANKQPTHAEFTIYLNSLPSFHFLKFRAENEVSIVVQITDLLLEAEQYLNTLSEFDIEENRLNSFLFEINLTHNFYLSIASIRALKIVWGNVLKAYQMKPTIFIRITINCNEQSDENTAIIAATTQALAAAIGGTDLIYISPFLYDSNTYGQNFPSRLARNIQNILIMEVFMDRVLDPASGSYYIDTLTENLSNEVWESFKSRL